MNRTALNHNIPFILASIWGLEGRLLVYDGEYMDFHEIKVNKNPKCPVCGGK